LTVVPEIVAVTRNQLAMIYEIGLAHGQEKVITKELLAAVFAAATGASVGALVIVHGSKLIVKRASLRVFQQIVLLLGGKITQQVLKSSISRWLPMVGAAAMAAWSHYSTKMIAKEAIAVFRKEIELEGEEIDQAASAAHDATAIQTEHLALEVLQRNKLQTLINLMLADGEASSSEKGFIIDLVNGMIADQHLSTGAQAALLAKIKTSAHAEVDLSGFRSHLEEAMGLMIDLVALARRDGVVRPAEREFIESVGKAINFSATDLEDLLAF
jgi:uncharacterized protein (DUF697 family)